MDAQEKWDVDLPSHFPRRIAKIDFSTLANDEVIRMSEFEIATRELYALPSRIPTKYGCLDQRLGTSDKAAVCGTCGKNLVRCPGHFGHIRLELPVFHIGYLRHILGVLNQVCKECSMILLHPDERLRFLHLLRNSKIEYLDKVAISKNIAARCRANRVCPYCKSLNGPCRKVGAIKIVHAKYKSKEPLKARDFDPLFDEAVSHNKDLKPHLKSAVEDVNALRALEIFKNVSNEDAELLLMNFKKARPEDFIIQSLPVPPVCIRPSVSMNFQGSNEDDLTMKMSEIVYVNNIIRDCLKKGGTVSMIMEDWEFLQLQTAMYITGEMPTGSGQQRHSKPIRGLCQRLKGKHGRFRGNLSGKRVDFSARTVISPDPNIDVDEVGVPEYIAKNLTFPEKVNRYNIERMKEYVRNGPDVHPGANFVMNAGDQGKRFLKYGDREAIASKLSHGDVIERHLVDGDSVLFNRQPSLHRLSIMSHRAKIMPWKTFRVNLCVCAPYNADFDGDEMNLHVPQTEEAMSEARHLMQVVHNMVTPRNGVPLVAATQDLISGAYLLTAKSVFLDRGQFCQICSQMFDAKTEVVIPAPAILAPVELWTGKQLFNVLLNPDSGAGLSVSIECREKSYTKAGVMCSEDGYVVFRRGKLMCGRLGKSTIGSGSKASIFFALIHDYSSKDAAACMSRISKLTSRYLMERGFSIGIDDVTPSERLSKLKSGIVQEGYEECEKDIQSFLKGLLQPIAGCNAEETLESNINGILSRIREDTGRMCLKELHPSNSTLVMALAGSKGSTINISQMVSCVGQQTVGGSRAPNGFLQRSLPHFEYNSKTPSAKGFVVNSFYSGLTPTEFFFHSMAGREGLVDTAVKTAETGYMQRRLMKALEDLSIEYDYTVRNSQKIVVQFEYGDDGLEPASMEQGVRPVDFERTLTHIVASVECAEEACLEPGQIATRIQELVDASRQPLAPKVRGDLGIHLGEFARTLDNRLRLARKFGGASANLAGTVFRITETQLKAFVYECMRKYCVALCEPGTAVGAIAGQSIGEPGTQMTLKTFHFAGVASMNVTLGVPRIKEIINATTKISTPIITATLMNPNEIKVARIVKGRLERTLLGEIASVMEEVISNNFLGVRIVLDRNVIEDLQLDINVSTVVTSLLRRSKMKLHEDNIMRQGDEIFVDVPSPENFLSKAEEARGQHAPNRYHLLQRLKRFLPKVLVMGIPSASRAVINDLGGGQGFNLLVEGTGLREVMTTSGVNGLQTVSNHIVEVEEVLGIEAARTAIIKEIQYTMASHGMHIDARHIMILADCMTYKGKVLGITRFGISKMRDSVLMLASFEKTVDHLFEAAARSRCDNVVGVSESIILGVPVPLGTATFKLLYNRPEKPKANSEGGLLLARSEPV